MQLENCMKKFLSKNTPHFIFFRPDYAKNLHVDDDEDEEEQEEEQIKATSGKSIEAKRKSTLFLVSHNEQDDRRIRRLQARQLNDDDNERDR
jgi:hypothetical protein